MNKSSENSDEVIIDQDIEDIAITNREDVHIQIHQGEYRRLNEDEREVVREKGQRFTLTIEEPYVCFYNNYRLNIPKGFMSDGATSAPDLGIAWMFHDWLYYTHKCIEIDRETGEEKEVEVSRKLADDFLLDIMRIEGYTFLSWIYKKVFRWNLLGKPSKGWNKSGRTGPTLYDDLFYTG